MQTAATRGRVQTMWKKAWSVLSVWQRRPCVAIALTQPSHFLLTVPLCYNDIYQHFNKDTASQTVSSFCFFWSAADRTWVCYLGSVFHSFSPWKETHERVSSYEWGPCIILPTELNISKRRQKSLFTQQPFSSGVPLRMGKLWDFVMLLCSRLQVVFKRKYQQLKNMMD